MHVVHASVPSRPERSRVIMTFPSDRRRCGKCSLAAIVLSLLVGVAGFAASSVSASAGVNGLAGDMAGADAAAASVRIDYEDGTKSSGTALRFDECCQHSIRVDDLPRTGRYSIRSDLHYGDPFASSAARVESYTLGIPDSFYTPGDTVYYGFSIYILSTWQRDSREDIVFQWKPLPDACESSAHGGKYPSAFLTVQPSGKWRLRVNSDANRCSTPDSVRKVGYDLADVKPGSWHDFVFKFKWSYGSDGRIDGWHQTNKNLGWHSVLTATGPNTFNDPDSTKAYLKWGIYKPAWNAGPTDVDSRMIFHDNIAVGRSFTAVNPAS